MNKVLFVFAATAVLAVCGSIQATAHKAEGSEVTNEVVTNNTITQEMKETNMQEVQAYLKGTEHSSLPQPMVISPVCVPSAYQRLSMAVFTL